MTYNKFTDSGIKRFEENVLTEVFHSMDNDYKDFPCIHITVGKNQITVPLHADSFQALLAFLEQSK